MRGLRTQLSLRLARQLLLQLGELRLLRLHLSLPLAALGFEFALDALGFDLGLGRVILKLGNLLAKVAEVLIRGFRLCEALRRFNHNLQRLLLPVAHDGERVLRLLSFVERVTQVADRVDFGIIGSHDAIARLQAGFFRRTPGLHLSHQHALALLDAEVVRQLRGQVNSGDAQA